MNRLLTFLVAGLFPLASVAVTPAPVGLLAAQKYPSSMAGQLTFLSSGDGYVGSGTVVQPRGVLTAGHNLYDEYGGWSTDLVFKRGHYGNSDLSVRRGQRIYVFTGYTAYANTYGGNSARAFARDTGGVFFRSTLADGRFLGWSTDVSLLTGQGRKVVMGYGAEVHSGEQLLSVHPPTPFRQVYRQFYESAGTGIEAGMSGGPVIGTLPNGAPTLCGTVVSGSDFPITGGIRVINAGTGDFIVRYLSD